EMDERERRRQEERMKEDWPIKSPGMVIGGSILTAVGGIGLFTGMFMGISGANCGIFSSFREDTGKRGARVILLIPRSGGRGVGIPLIVVGKKKVPPRPELRQEPVASVRVGPQGAAFKFTF